MTRQHSQIKVTIQFFRIHCSKTSTCTHFYENCLAKRWRIKEMKTTIFILQRQTTEMQPATVYFENATRTVDCMLPLAGIRHILLIAWHTCKNGRKCFSHQRVVAKKLILPTYDNRKPSINAAHRTYYTAFKIQAKALSADQWQTGSKARSVACDN